MVALSGKCVSVVWLSTAFEVSEQEGLQSEHCLSLPPVGLSLVGPSCCPFL